MKQVAKHKKTNKKRNYNKKSKSNISEEKNECPICFEVLVEKETCYPDNCPSHKFCKPCLLKWNNKKTHSCPFCRKYYKHIKNSEGKSLSNFTNNILQRRIKQKKARRVNNE